MENRQIELAVDSGHWTLDMGQWTYREKERGVCGGMELSAFENWPKDYDLWRFDLPSGTY